MTASEASPVFGYGRLHWAAGLWNVLVGLVMLLGSGVWLGVALGHTVLGPISTVDWVNFAASVAVYPVTVVAGVVFLRAARRGKLVGRWCNVLPVAGAGILLVLFVAELLMPTGPADPFELTIAVLEEWGRASSSRS